MTQDTEREYCEQREVFVNDILSVAERIVRRWPVDHEWRRRGFDPYERGQLIRALEDAYDSRRASTNREPQESLVDPTERAGESPQAPAVAMPADAVEWIVNDNAELGVKIGAQFFFLYKGGSLVYESGTHDDGSPMHWRHVFKREFGECAHPVNYKDPTHWGTVSLDDSDEWKPLPPAPANVSGKDSGAEALRQDQTFAGFRVVIDPTMPPDTIKFVQPEKTGAPVAAALREALESLYSAVIEQNRRGAEWDPEVFDRLMPALAASKRALAGETP